MGGTSVKPEQTYEGPEQSFNGPTKQRECRDIVFLVIFIVFLGGMSYTATLALYYGSPNRLIFGIDSWGNACNQDNKEIPKVALSGQDTTGLKFLFSYDYKDVIQNKNNRDSVCVKMCPNMEISTLKSRKNFTKVTGSNLCRYDNKTCPTLPILEEISLFHRCIPKAAAPGIKINFFPGIGDDLFEKIALDLETSWRQICYLTLVAIGISLLFCILLRFFAKFIIWFIIIALPLALFGISGYCWFVYHQLITGEGVEFGFSVPTTFQQPKTWLIIAIVLTCVVVIMTLIVLVIRKRIALVTQLFKESGKAIISMPFLMLQPFLTFIISAGCLAGLIYIFVSIESAGKFVVDYKTGYVSLTDHDILQYLKWYHIFGIFWIVYFIISCQDFVIASSIAIWYFCRDKSQVSLPILRSIYRLVRYHLGSIAFGSLIIAIISMVRYILEVVERKLKPGSGSITDFLFKCCKCCLWCFEKIIKFLNKNAYIEIAIYGYGFCKSAKLALQVIVSNALRLTAINSVGDFVLFMGKMASVAATGGIGYEILKTEKNLNYLWVPITVACLIAYFIATCFLSAYEMAIDTLFICFCEDCSMNDGINRPYFMSKDLMTYVENSTAALKKLKSQSLTKA